MAATRILKVKTQDSPSPVEVEVMMNSDCGREPAAKTQEDSSPLLWKCVISGLLQITLLACFIKKLMNKRTATKL